MTAPTIRNRFLDYLFQVYSGMNNQHPVILYEGEITHSVMKSFSALAEEFMSREKEPEDVQRKVYHAMVESLQNINHHASRMPDEPEDAAGRGAFILCFDQGHYYVMTSNMVDSGRVEEMTGLMDRVNRMTEEELTECYKKQLKDGRISEEGGAGLGFIDLRRKTGQKVEYRFEKAGTDSSFYLFTIKISRKD